MPRPARTKQGRAAARRTPRRRRPTQAEKADRHDLYQRAVQDVQSEIDFVDQTFHTLRGKKAARLREDFCGTAASACEWVTRRSTNTAVGLDLHAPTLEWGRLHNVARLTPAQARRLTLLNRDVLSPPRQATGVDIVLAMNFSYWIFKERAALKRYFRRVRASLAPGGVFFLDHYGGSEANQECSERRDCGGFTYIWDQHSLNPITGAMNCRIHFRFPDGSRMNDAFVYDWRLWSLTEIQDILRDAGFSRVTVYWEGDDGDGGGNGEFTPTDQGEADDAYITYIVAER